MADMTRLDLNKTQRKTLGAVITIFVHARDVVEIMIQEGIAKITDFGWTKQLPTYGTPWGARRLLRAHDQHQLSLRLRIPGLPASPRHH